MIISHRHWAVLALFSTLLLNSSARAGGTAPDAPKSDAHAVRALLDAVLARHTSVRAARAEVDASQSASEAAAQPLFNPELAVATERTDISTTTLELSQTLDWHDKRSEHSAMAEQQRLAAAEALRAAEYEVAASTLTALARFHTARELATLRNNQAQLMRQVSDLADARLKAGDIGQVEDDLVHLAAAKAANEADQAHAALAEATAGLELATQLSYDTWPMPPSNIDNDDLPPQPLPFGTPAGASATPWDAVLDALPAVRGARAQWQSADVQARLTDKEGRADPTLSVTLGREDEEDLVGVAVSIPLQLRRTGSAQTRAARHSATAALSRFDEARQRARAQMLQAAAQFRLAVSTWQRWQKAGHRPMGEQLHTLERLWRGGDLATSDYLLQVGAYIDAQALAVELRGHAWETWFQWSAASGRLADWLAEPR